MRVFVTGSAGFVGQYVCQRFGEQGTGVVGAVRHVRKDGSPFVEHQIAADLSDDLFAEKVVDSVERCDVIVHLAADITVPESPNTIGANIYGTRNVTSLAEKWKVGKLIFLSSIPVIGMPLELPVTELHPVAPRTLYHMSKYVGERIIANSAVADKSLILRIPSPIGAGMKATGFIPVILRKFLNNESVELYGSGERIQNYLDVRDLAETVCRCASGDRSGLYLLGGSRSYSNRETADICRRAAGSSSEIITGRKADPEEDLKWIISCEKARAELGFSPKYDLEDSIRWIAEGLKNETPHLL